MARSMIGADSATLKQLTQNLEKYATEYQENYNKLTNLVNEIVAGDFTGDPATDFLNKYEAKKDMLTSVYQRLDEAKSYAHQEEVKFGQMIDDLQGTMK